MSGESGLSSASVLSFAEASNASGFGYEIYNQNDYSLMAFSRLSVSPFRVRPQALLACTVISAAGVLASGTPANAIGFACPVANVSNSSACQIGASKNDSPIPGSVNSVATTPGAVGLFEFDDWQFAGKDESGGLLEDLIGTSGATDFDPGVSVLGLYDITATVQSSWSEVMLVLKGGNNDYQGYLLSDYAGSWESPFSNKKGDTQAVSHMSLYYREGSNATIPTPALLPGLLGFGMSIVRKRRQQKTSP